MTRLGRVHAAITAVAMLARRVFGEQKSGDKATGEEAAERRRTFLYNGRRYYARTDVFGAEPPLIDPGDVHAYMRRNR